MMASTNKSQMLKEVQQSLLKDVLPPFQTAVEACQTLDELKEATKTSMAQIKKLVFPEQSLISKVFGQQPVSQSQPLDDNEAVELSKAIFNELQRYEQAVSTQYLAFQANIRTLEQIEKQFDQIQQTSQLQLLGKVFIQQQQAFARSLQDQKADQTKLIDGMRNKCLQMYEQVRDVISENISKLDQVEPPPSKEDLQQKLESMSAMRERSDTASEHDEQQYHFFGAEKELSENSVIAVVKKAKHPYKYRLTQQYLKDTAKVQQFQSSTDSELSFNKYLVGVGQEQQNTYFIFSDDSRWAGGKITMTGKQHYPERVLSEKDLKRIRTIKIQYRNNRVKQPNLFTGVQFFDEKNKKILDSTYMHNSNFGYVETTLKQGERILGVKSSTRANDSYGYHHYDVQFILGSMNSAD